MRDPNKHIPYYEGLLIDFSDMCLSDEAIQRLTWEFSIELDSDYRLGVWEGFNVCSVQILDSKRLFQTKGTEDFPTMPYVPEWINIKKLPRAIALWSIINLTHGYRYSLYSITPEIAKENDWT